MNDNIKPTRADEAQLVQQSQVTQPVHTVTENEQIVLPLRDEYLEVRKHWVQSGEVVVRKTVDTATQTVPIDLDYEEVQVDRVPVNRVMVYGEKSEPWWDGDVMVVPIVEEELVVMKRQVVKEELRIYKRRLSRRESVSDTVRSEQIQIETSGRLQPVNDEDKGRATNR